MRIFRRKSKINTEIHPDEILIDAENIAELDRDQFEGRIERPLRSRSFFYPGAFLVLVFFAFIARASDLQLVDGSAYAQQAQQNQLVEKVIFADRGSILDVNGIPLAYNVRSSVADDFAQRVYAPYVGLSHVVGYVKPPAKDSSGVYYQDDFEGMDGTERAFDGELSGTNGLALTEIDAHGNVVSQSVEQPPVPGQTITLSIDANVTQGFYDTIAKIVQQSGFQGGAGVIMNVHTGALLALTSYPEYSQTAMTDGNAAAVASYNSDPDQPFLDRAVDGLYSPGSIVKPIVAVGALVDGVISPSTQILSTGSISIPNPYDPAQPSIFKDWRANGLMDMQQAIALSSDVYFYEVGGGYQNQPGLGITELDKYFNLFGFGSLTGLQGFTEAAGTVSSPAWKALNFPSDPTWRLGDTYHTAIGQYGTQITPLQAVREAAAIANGGILLTPTLLASSTPQGVNMNLPQGDLEVVQQGMRLGVTWGIVQEVNFPFVAIAAKDGVAQVGSHNQYQNSSMIGYWPYQDPEYAFAVVLQQGPAGTLIESPTVMQQFFEWMEANEPQYLQ